VRESIRWFKSSKPYLVLAVASVLWLWTLPGYAQCNDPTPTRPILFVHGFYGSSTDWGGGNDYGTGGIKGSVIASLSSKSGYTNTSTYVLYFNGSNVLISLGNPATDPVVSNISGNAGYVPCDARFFSIRFYGWAGPAVAFDPQVVATVSIITKAYELSEVIKAITGLTFSKDVIVAAHSMGAVDTRAYIEQLGSTYDGPCNAYPCYEAGSLDYAGDIAHVVTVDGANAGSDWSYVLALLLGKGNANWINVFELEPYSPLIQTLNYHDSYNGRTANSLPQGLGIDALIDYYFDEVAVPCTLDPLLSCNWDNIVTTDSQSIKQALSDYPQVGLNDINDSYSVTDPTIILDPNCYLGIYPFLHSLLCLSDWHFSTNGTVGGLVSGSIGPYVGGQLTQIMIQVLYNGQQYSGANLLLNGPNGSTPLTSTAQPTLLLGPMAPASPALPSVPPVAPTPYTLTYQSGGPGGAGAPTIEGTDASGNVCSPCYITSTSGNGVQPNWAVTFAVSFPSGNANSPTATTLPPTSVLGDGATLQGTVNPNGAATTAWFEWGTSPSYGNTTVSQPMGSGSTAVPVSFALSGLASNTTYYYRLDAANSRGTSSGGPQSFMTLSTLPAPTLTAPPNGGSGIPTSPTFSWTSVAGATSYRIMVATTPSALPSDPTSSTCGIGCVIDDTPSGTSYTPGNGILVAGTTYYWEVHARSPQQYGNWSAVFNFSTAGPSLSSITINPSTVISGSLSTVTVTLNGPAPQNGVQVNLTTTNSSAFPVPSSLSVSGGSTTGSSSVQAGTVSTLTNVTVTATYNSTAVSGVVIVSPSGGSVFLSSFTITPSTIVGGYSPQGNVFLTGPAPAGGAVVNLFSNNPHFVQVPPSQTVTVQPGYTSAGFLITTSFTSATVGATITASYNGTAYGAGLTVLPVAVSGITFYPSTVNAGDSAPLTVYLTGPAAAGTSVSLVSSNPSVLQVPSSVSLTAGANEVSITGTTFAVATQTNVTVTATYNGSSGQATLTVVPVPPLVISDLGLSPTTITGGNNATGTVYLSGYAPPNGASVSLSSSSGLVQPPATVLVPAGTWYAPFSAPTSVVSSVTNVTITGTYGGATQNAVLTLVPPLPYLATLSFGPSTVDSGTSTQGTITLTAPAPLGGISVNLTSSWWWVAETPPSCYVPAGLTTSSFTVPTPPIDFIATSTINASYNGTTQSGIITVVPSGTPFGPSSLAFNPTSVAGGASATGNLLFTYPAPAGGATLQLSSDNPLVQVSPSISVPDGATSAQFPVTTSSVAVITTATVTVSFGGVSQSSLLTVKPTISPAANPVPFLSVPLTPVSHTPGGSGLPLTLTGSGFVPGAQAFWNGTALPTTFQSSTQLQASVPATDIQENGTAFVTVTNPGAGSARSNGLPEQLTYLVATSSFSNLSITASSIPSLVATADLNRDGKVDLVVGGGVSSTLSVFLGNGDGAFGQELLLQAVNPSSVVVGDFNGDGKLDIAAVSWNMNNSSAIRIFLGNGDGTFTTAPAVVFPNSIGDHSSLAAADLNGDGYLDLVVTGNYLTQAYVLLGNGDGTFGPPVGFGLVNQPFSVAVADFDGDGKLDLALADFNNQAVAVLLGNGNGTFRPQTEYATGGYAYAISVADFNVDGHPDIAIANAGPCCGSGAGVAVLRNNGNGTFASPVTYGAGKLYYSVSTDDVNGDGELDLLVTDGQMGLLYLGNGDGTLATNPVSIPMGQNPYAVAIADLNGDGAPDMVVPNQISGTGNVTVLLQSIAPVLQVSPSILSFTASQGEGTPPPLTLGIVNTGGGTETWSAAASQPWVVLGQTSGTAPSTLSVSVNPVGLNPGTYTATITVTATGASNSPQAITVTLTVNPASVVVSSLAFSPNTLTGAGTATGTVTLSGSAPVGGASVALSSNNSAVQVPLTVTVPVGLVSGTFTATASSVTTQTIVTVTAMYNGVSTTATLTLNPNTTPLTVSPTALSYGNQGINSTSASKKVTLTNNTGAIVTISSIAISGTDPADFTQSTTTCGQTLGLKKSCTISITFTPSALGARSAALIITDSAVNSPQTVALSGTGVLQVTLSPTALAFGNQVDGSTSAPKTVTLTNNTSAALSISSVAITGSNASEFAVSSNGCGSSIGGHSSCKISVTFAPVTAGAKTASLKITDSANNSPQSASLTGTGIAPVTLTPSSLTFAAQKVGTTSPAKKITVQNNLGTTLTFSGITLTGTNAGDFAQSATTCGATLAAGASCTVSITFTPTAQGSRVAVLDVADNAITSPQTANISGTGK